MTVPERCLPNTILKSYSATWERSTEVWTSSYIAVRNTQIGRHRVWVVEVGERGIRMVGAGSEHRVGVGREAF